MDPNVLHNLSYGMYIVSSNDGPRLNGQIANTVFQITSVPVTIAISINKENLTHQFIEKSLAFSLSVLDENTPLSFIGKFGFKTGRKEDKFKDTVFTRIGQGVPVVTENTICYITADVVNRLDCGTHTLFLGKLREARMVRAGKPMTYDYYHQVKRGTTPASAPTFIKEEMPLKEEVPMQKYRCKICNYIYDPVVGDPDGGIQPLTPFEKIPEGWVCPICGADKSEFIKEGVCNEAG